MAGEKTLTLTFDEFMEAIAPKPAKRRYEAPRVVKKRSVARVTLVSGATGASGGTVATPNTPPPAS